MLQSLMRLVKRKDGDAHDPRRREYRYKVEIVTQIQIEGATFEGMIADLSPSGALVTVDAPLHPGMTLEIRLPKFGEITAQVMHAGAGFCGVQFVNPEKNRDRIEAWLRKHSD